MSDLLPSVSALSKKPKTKPPKRKTAQEEDSDTSEEALSADKFADDELQRCQLLWDQKWNSRLENNYWEFNSMTLQPKRQKDRSDKSMPDQIRLVGEKWILSSSNPPKEIILKDNVCAMVRIQWDLIGRTGSGKFEKDFVDRYTGITRDELRDILKLLPQSNIRRRGNIPMSINVSSFHKIGIRF
jgi:hypothetical protein